MNRDGAQVWYGPIGKDWQVRRFKHVARIVGGQVDPTDERYRDLPLYAPNHMQSGTGRLLSVGTAEEQAAESGKYLIGAGDILYSKIRPALRKVIVAPSDGLCSADVYGIRPANGELESRFLFYVLLSEGFYQYSLLESDRVAMPKINREALGECPLVFASASRQRRIADFLDRKTAAIDELIAKKERLVELLAEKCQALITQAVTKGLDPNVPMQDSGIGWIGAIPRHWTIARVKQVARLESGHTPSRSVPEHWLDTNDIPWVSLNDTKALARHDEISETTYYINQLGLQNSSARMLPARVVVFTREATIGKAAITTRPMAVSQHIIAWVCGTKITPEFLLRVFYAMEPALERYTFGATIKTIGMDDVRELVTPVPPPSEQRGIVEDVVARCDQLDVTTSRVLVQIDRLREYRQALIAAAVTGQLDVSSADVSPEALEQAEAQIG